MRQIFMDGYHFIEAVRIRLICVIHVLYPARLNQRLFQQINHT